MGWLDDLRRMMAPPQADPTTPQMDPKWSHGGWPGMAAIEAFNATRGMGEAAKNMALTDKRYTQEELHKRAVGSSMALLGTTRVVPMGPRGAALGTFMGREARYAPTQRLDEAMAARRAGANPDDIWHATEVETRMPHGQPIWEIDDSAARWNPAFLRDVNQHYTSGMPRTMQYNLRDAWEHPEYFANLPEMANAKLLVGQPGQAGWKAGGANAYFQPHYFDPSNPQKSAGTVGVRSDLLVGDPAAARLSVIHEGGHGADWVGGRPHGASTQTMATRGIQALKTAFQNTKPGTPEFDRLAKLYRDTVANPAGAGEAFFNLYRSDPGEWIARVGSARADYTPAERHAIIPWQSADMPMSQLVSSPYSNVPWRQRQPGQAGMVPDLPDPANSRLTQVATTGGSYDKAINQLRSAGVQGPIIDYGAGRGLSSAKHGLESFEPYPSGWNPTYRDPAAIPDQSYEGLVNLNVLNVLPPALRQEAVRNMGRIIRPGGAGIIGTRGADVMSAKGTPGGEPMSLIIGQGDQARYQKGFTQRELMQYLQEHLGDAYALEPSKIAKAGAFVRRTR